MSMDISQEDWVDLVILKKKRGFTTVWEGQWKQVKLIFGNSRGHGVKSTENLGGGG